ncbi:BBE domain-containing protein [Actinosynnema sp. NPDC091369]
MPAPGELYDGSYVNQPDVDLADPAWNTSGVPWHTLYYEGNYPRLRQVRPSGIRATCSTTRSRCGCRADRGPAWRAQPARHAGSGLRWSLGRVPRNRLNATLSAKALA